MFLGTIVGPPGHEAAEPGWIFVQGRNRMVRRVDVTHATIVPVRGTSGGQRKKCGLECLAIGQEVRVTAEQDLSGEWRAKRVEILRPAKSKGQTSRSAAGSITGNRSLGFPFDYAQGFPPPRAKTACQGSGVSAFGLKLNAPNVACGPCSP